MFSYSIPMLFPIVLDNLILQKENYQFISKISFKSDNYYRNLQFRHSDPDYELYGL